MPTSAAWWVPVVLVAATTLSALLGLAAKQYCRSHGWVGSSEYTHLCYSDLPVLFRLRGLAEGVIPYLQGGGRRAVEYPVLLGALMWAEARVTPGVGYTQHRALVFFDVNLLASYAFAVVTVLATARVARHRPWDAALVAAAPGLALTATINWDMAAVALTSLAVLAWARAHPMAAGTLIGLGTATKFYPVLLLGPVLLLCLRVGRMDVFARTAAAALGAWLAVNVPVMRLAWRNWSVFYTRSGGRGAGFSSVWLVMHHRGLTVPAHDLNVVAAGTFALCAAVIAWSALHARRRPRFAQLAFLIVAAFVLTNKVYSPQYVLWLIPLAALARPRWRDVLVWQAAEVIHFVAVWLYLAAGRTPRGHTALVTSWYDVAVCLHVLGTVWLAAVVIRDVHRPARDPVRSEGDDDPTGGVLDGAPDVLVLRRTAP